MSIPQVPVRAITDAEASVVERALEVAATHDSASTLRATIRSLQVVSHCGCGCASIDFIGVVKGEIPSIVADAVARSETGEHLGIIVRALHNQLSGLEIYNYSDNPARLPVVGTISSYEDAGSDSAA